MSPHKLYLAHFSIHGLLRGQNPELGRDADTGGQIRYVVELAKELGKQEEVGRVDLFTRQIFDSRVSQDYAQPIEQLSENAYIIRLPFGPRRYLRKEKLWPYLEICVDQALQYFRRLQKIPDVIHGHYADAGNVGSLLAHLLEVPFIFTGHSLGRVKQARLLEKGMSLERIREEYQMGYRIEAEERALDAAARVIASTHQEIKEQYEPYDHYEPERMIVISPGVDLERFYPVIDYHPPQNFYEKLAKFLRDPRKPMILALSRADERKNIPALIQAYGQNPTLQELANLVIVAGNRENILELDRETRTVFQKILVEIDRYDLYGKVAYPKHHRPEEVPEFYRWAVMTGGLLVNPALTEPFGLTLIEAAATGLPIVATADGGPRDILSNCHNGVLIDSLDTKAIGEALVSALADKIRWQQWSEAGKVGVRRHYAWSSHAERYLSHLEKAIAEVPRTRFYHQQMSREGRASFGMTNLLLSYRFIISDIDDTLIGDAEALQELLSYLEQSKHKFVFGIATGRRIESAVEILEQWQVPLPGVFITSVGSEIYYGAHLLKDSGWERHINFRWEPDKLRAVLANCQGLELQPPEDQRPFKISYFVDEKLGKAKPRRSSIIKCLRQEHLAATVIVTQGKLVDILPIRASKGSAVRYLAYRWGVPGGHFLVAGDSGNDEEMLKGEMLGVVVGNYSKELERLRNRPRIYFAKAGWAKGIIEGIEHFTFLEDKITITEEE